MADIEGVEDKDKKGGMASPGRRWKLWQLKLKSRLWECWRLRRSSRTSYYLPIAALAITLVLTMSFIWRISDVDLNYCVATASREQVEREKYTVVVNTFKRPERLEKSIRHYSRCRGVDAIRIVWSESPNPPRELVSASPLPVIFDVHTNNSINNRFRPLDDVKTEGIFNVDDDILVDCSSLYFGFQTWRTARDTLVGYNPRIHSKSAGECKYNYKQWWHVWWGGTYSMVLTKAAFCHHKYFQKYTEELSSDVWAHVHRNKNCEDIAMQFMISNLTGLPPIWVQGSYSDSGVLDFKGGISTGANHYDKRSECVTKFVDLFGGIPLVETSVVAVPMSSWTPMKTPPAIWEWIHKI